MDKMPPVTTSTDAMDMEEVDAITKMILDKTKIKARRMQRRSRLIKGWDMCNGTRIAIRMIILANRIR